MKGMFGEFPPKSEKTERGESESETPVPERDTAFENAAREIKLKGFRFHAQEHDKGGRDPKTYHVSEHPRTLEKRALKMAKALNLSSKQLAVIQMAVAWHDTVIEYDKAGPSNILAMIRRHRGARKGDQPKETEGNEAKSARLLEQEMRKANKQAGREIFTEEQIHTAVWSIDATYPDVNLGPDFKGAPFEEYPYYNTAISQNPALGELFNKLKEQGTAKGPLFFQPHLEKPLENKQPVPREVLVTALADLGTAGLAEKEEFFKEGDDEMRELYANLRSPEVMRRLTEGNGDADRIDREKVITALLGWLNSQAGFAVWQSLRFEKIVHLLKQRGEITPEEERGLREQFSHYEDNIRAAHDRAGKLREETEQIKSTAGEKEAFLRLARSMHYEI